MNRRNKEPEAFFTGFKNALVLSVPLWLLIYYLLR